METKPSAIAQPKYALSTSLRRFWKPVASRPRERRTVWSAVAGVAMFCGAMQLHASEPLDLFDSETAALNHCSGDDVTVWLDVPAHTFWLKGQRGYGSKPRDGGYTCRSDAVRSGNRAARD